MYNKRNVQPENTNNTVYENTVTFHLTNICSQISLTENISKNYEWTKSDILFNQRPDGNKFDTENNWADVLSLIIEKPSSFFSLNAALFLITSSFFVKFEFCSDVTHIGKVRIFL